MGLVPVNQYYYTLGHDLLSTGTLKEGLDARSFKGEIILMYGTVNFALPLLQSWTAINREGYAHTLVLMSTEKDCRRMTELEPQFGCTWSSDQLPDKVRHQVMCNLGFRVNVITTHQLCHQE